MTTTDLRGDRPAYRPYVVTVTTVTELSPHFVRVGFTGADLNHFGQGRLDQRIKLIFPIPRIGLTDIGFTNPEVIAAGDWYKRWRALPDSQRNPIRTFTIRHVRPALREIDVDFFRHESAQDGSADGAAAQWLTSARPGDTLVIVGPDARSRHSCSGIEWNPGAARRLLLAGDETAVPAIANILETLGDEVTADVFVEIGSETDALALNDSASVTWLERTHEGSPLLSAVDRWARTMIHQSERNSTPQILDDIDVDAETLWEATDCNELPAYIWMAGEAGVVKSLRRLLVQHHNIDRSCIAFMGYWRMGRAEAQ